MKQEYSGVRGTYDFSPRESRLFNRLSVAARGIFSLYGYEEIILPVLEEEAVFKKGAGETSDIVERQIFRVSHSGEKEAGEAMILRPEGTAQVVRYFIQNSLHKQGDFYKFFYIGPMFRGERPQKGRLRQFHHFGVEAIGSRSPYLDAETVTLAMRLIEGAGLKNTELKINTLGCKADKDNFAATLKNRLSSERENLCADCRRRLDKNPLRVIDCKNDSCKKIVEGLGLGDKHICLPCKEHFSLTLKTLDSAGVKYTLSPLLVRGLDYYTNTVFEITSPNLGSQDAIAAGGRYDGLIASLGGPDMPAIGFALGVERLMLALGEVQDIREIDAFVVYVSGELTGRCVNIVDYLRKQGVSADMDYCGKSLKAQFRQAERKNSRFAVIAGEDELKEDSVMLKCMKDGKQEKVKIGELVNKLKIKN